VTGPGSTSIPAYSELLWPTLRAVRELGHSAKLDEIDERVVEKEEFSDGQLGVLHKDGPRSEIEYRIAWARTYLKGVGALNDDWREELLEVLLNMPPIGFEHLAKRLLRAAGFINASVTGGSGDGGIDGVGVYRLSLVSFPVYFQCKRYKGTVGPEKVRDFRGAMQGRGGEGLLITTGSFTSEAKKEATRDGAPPIDLIDGEHLCDLLKEHHLGVETRTRTIEEVSIRPDFFSDPA
jgi:restriction system protein